MDEVGKDGFHTIADELLANEIFDLGLVYLLNQESDITKEELIRASLERGDSVQTLAQRFIFTP